MQKIKLNKLPKSEIEIEGELPSEVFESYFKKAIKRIGENFEIDGFRKGKVPENIMLSHVPEVRILEEMADMALSEHYPKILEENKIDAISRPEVAITKLARKNPLGFKIKTAVLPDIILPDYKDLAKKVIKKEEKELNVAVTDKDVEDTIMDIRKSRAPKKHMAETEPHVHKDGVAHDHEKEAAVELPEFNDEFVKGLGPFTSVEDFKTKLKENLKLEKENLAKEKMRLKIVEEIIEKSKIDVPDILINVELDKILYRMESDITQMGLKFEDYLKHMNKTREDLRKEFRIEGEKKAKLALILNEIAKQEKITAEVAEVEKEVTHILEHYKDADPERARMHASNVLTNEKIFQFLESQVEN